MHRTTIFVSLLALALASAGCGSTKKATTTAATTTEAPPTQTAVTDQVNLTGVRPAGSTLARASPTGSAHAVITVNPSKGELCWTFSQLRNVTAPTVARLFRNFPGASGEGGFLLGHKYKPSGCIHLQRIILELMVEKPQKFYVSIHDAQFPGGAVRGPLEP